MMLGTDVSGLSTTAATAAAQGLSIVVPLYNEAAGLAFLHDRLGGLAREWELFGCGRPLCDGRWAGFGRLIGCLIWGRAGGGGRILRRRGLGEARSGEDAGCDERSSYWMDCHDAYGA